MHVAPRVLSVGTRGGTRGGPMGGTRRGSWGGTWGGTTARGSTSSPQVVSK